MESEIAKLSNKSVRGNGNGQQYAAKTRLSYNSLEEIFSIS